MTCSEDESADTASLAFNFAHGAINSDVICGPLNINHIIPPIIAELSFNALSLRFLYQINRIIGES